MNLLCNRHRIPWRTEIVCRDASPDGGPSRGPPVVCGGLVVAACMTRGEMGGAFLLRRRRNVQQAVRGADGLLPLGAESYAAQAALQLQQRRGHLLHLRREPHLQHNLGFSRVEGFQT